MTIGRGYATGNRIKLVVQQDIVKAGVLLYTAKAMADGAGIKGEKTPAIKQYERGRNSAHYLIERKPVNISRATR